MATNIWHKLGARDSRRFQLLYLRYSQTASRGLLSQSGEAKEVIEIDTDLATVIIGTVMLMIAFATLVIKIIEVARSK